MAIVAACATKMKVVPASLLSLFSFSELVKWRPKNEPATLHFVLNIFPYTEEMRTLATRHSSPIGQITNNRIGNQLYNWLGSKQKTNSAVFSLSQRPICFRRHVQRLLHLAVQHVGQDWDWKKGDQMIAEKMLAMVGKYCWRRLVANALHVHAFMVLCAPDACRYRLAEATRRMEFLFCYSDFYWFSRWGYAVQWLARSNLEKRNAGHSIRRLPPGTAASRTRRNLNKRRRTPLQKEG